MISASPSSVLHVTRKLGDWECRRSDSWRRGQHSRLRVRRTQVSVKASSLSEGRSGHGQRVHALELNDRSDDAYLAVLPACISIALGTISSLTKSIDTVPTNTKVYALVKQTFLQPRTNVSSRATRSYLRKTATRADKDDCTTLYELSASSEGPVSSSDRLICNNSILR